MCRCKPVQHPRSQYCFLVNSSLYTGTAFRTPVHQIPLHHLHWLGIGVAEPAWLWDFPRHEIEKGLRAVYIGAKVSSISSWVDVVAIIFWCPKNINSIGFWPFSSITLLIIDQSGSCKYLTPRFALAVLSSEGTWSNSSADQTFDEKIQINSHIEANMGSCHQLIAWQISAVWNNEQPNPLPPTTHADVLWHSEWYMLCNPKIYALSDNKACHLIYL